MRVSEQEFLYRYMPVCHLALVARAMYYGNGDWANRPQSSEQIRRQLYLPDSDSVFRLLDMGDDILTNGPATRKVRV